MSAKSTLNSVGPEIAVVTAHGRQLLSSRPDERLIDVLSRNNVPWSAVSIYQRRDGEEAMHLCSGLEKTMAEFDTDQLLLYFNRNVNPFKFSPEKFQIVNSTDQNSESTEYIYQNLKNSDASAQSYLKSFHLMSAAILSLHGWQKPSNSICLKGPIWLWGLAVVATVTHYCTA